MNPPTKLGRGMDLGLLHVPGPIALRGQIFCLDDIVVVKRHPGDAQGGELKGNLPSDGSHAKDDGMAASQALRRHQPPLAHVTVGEGR
jgi:hypothetical protein